MRSVPCSGRGGKEKKASRRQQHLPLQLGPEGGRRAPSPILATHGGLNFNVSLSLSLVQSFLLCKVHPPQEGRGTRFYLPLSSAVSTIDKRFLTTETKSYARRSSGGETGRARERAGRLSNVFPIPFLQLFPLVSRGQVSVSFRQPQRLLREKAVNKFARTITSFIKSNPDHSACMSKNQSDHCHYRKPCRIPISRVTQYALSQSLSLNLGNWQYSSRRRRRTN